MVVAFIVVVLAVMFILVAMVLGVAAVVVFVIPVSLVQLPAFFIVVVMRVAPVGALVGRTIPSSLDPAVVAAIGGPVSFYPGVARTGHRSAGLVAKWWRRGSDVDGNLGRAGDGDRNRQEYAMYAIEFQLVSPFRSWDFDELCES